MFFLLLCVFLFIFRWSLNCLYFGFPIPFGIFRIFLLLHFYIIHWNIPQWTNWVRSGHDRMVVGFISTYAISVYHHWRCKFESHSGDVYSIQHYAIKFVSTACQWFSLSTSVSSINKTDCHDIAEILLKWH